MQRWFTILVLSFLVLSASAAVSPLYRSGKSKPNPTTISSCSEWNTVYVAHWMKLPECHDGTSSTSCCELYDLMAKSIRIFNEKLGCKFSDYHQYENKFSTHCSSSGRVPRPDPRPGAATNTHGSGPVQVLDQGKTPATGHTVSGGCLNCGTGGGGGCQGPNCGYTPPPVTPCYGSHCGCTTGNCGRPSGCHSGNCGRPSGCHSGNCGRPSGCHSGNCGRPSGCHSGNCGRPSGCTTGHCGGGCVGSNCGKPPVNNCIGYNCGCKRCCVAPSCYSGGGGTGTSTGTGTGTGTSGQPNQGPAIIIPPDDDDDVCFHGSGAVKLQDGGVKLMTELRVGDVVHVGEGKFSEVFMFTHQDENKRSTYVNMTVGSGEYIMVTPTHYMYSKNGLQLAGELKEGDAVEMDDGRVEQIVKRQLVRDKGLFNPQTYHGDIAVSGFRASTYTRTIKYETAHSLLAPLRAMYRICGAHISAAF